MEFLKQETVDGTERNLDALYQLFPQCFTEAIDESDGKTIRRVVDFQKLRELLGDFAEDDVSEAYEFTWVGKNAAKREAARPIRKTLRPCEEESVDWETTKNLYIEGDNLEVLKLLQSAYMGKVKMIYIDPPYNTGNDFVYHDDFSMSQEDYQIGSGNIDEDGVRLRKNTATNGRFHSDWCSMIYSRLLVARSLLADDGIIFISINDYEVRNMKILCDEIYGEDNFIAQVCVVTGANQSGEGVLIQKNIEYCLVYGKNISQSILTRVDKTEESWRNLNDAPTPLSTRLDMGYTIYYNPSNKDLIPVFDYDKNKVSTNSLADVYKDDANLIGQGYIPVRPGFRNNKLHRWRWGIDTFNERKSEVCIFENKGSYIPKFKQCGYNAPKNIWYYGGGAKDGKGARD